MTGEENTKNSDRTIGRLFIQADIWSMQKGEITELRYKEDVYVRKQKRTGLHLSAKVSYLEKWIRAGSFSGFTLEMFYKDYPLQQKNKRLPGHISNLISEGVLIQMGKDKFKVNR